MEKYESIPLNEQETTISFWRDEGHATVWTNDRTTITKLELREESPENYKCVDVGRAKTGGGILDKRYRISDKGLLSFRPRKRVIPEEQKAALAERLKRAE